MRIQGLETSLLQEALVRDYWCYTYCPFTGVVHFQSQALGFEKRLDCAGGSGSRLYEAVVSRHKAGSTSITDKGRTFGTACVTGSLRGVVSGYLGAGCLWVAVVYGGSYYAWF